jgi:NADPH-dependent 2,4-dienoyl-CoA reductase/sulfur reductase-like enzyme
MQPLIIVGAGLAGWTTAREFRKLDADTPVLLVTADSGDFYAKPSLSNAFAQGRTPAQLVSTPAAKMAQTHKVTLLAHTQALAIDPARCVVTTRVATLPTAIWCWPPARRRSACPSQETLQTACCPSIRCRTSRCSKRGWQAPAVHTIIANTSSSWAPG